MTRDEFRQAVIDQYNGPAISAAWAADAALAVLDAEQLTPVRVIGLAPWTLTELIVGDLEETLTELIVGDLEEVKSDD